MSLIANKIAKTIAKTTISSYYIYQLILDAVFGTFGIKLGPGGLRPGESPLPSPIMREVPINTSHKRVMVSPQNYQERQRHPIDAILPTTPDQLDDDILLAFKIATCLKCLHLFPRRYQLVLLRRALLQNSGYEIEKACVS